VQALVQTQPEDRVRRAGGVSLRPQILVLIGPSGEDAPPLRVAPPIILGALVPGFHWGEWREGGGYSKLVPSCATPRRSRHATTDLLLPGVSPDTPSGPGALLPSGFTVLTAPIP
jgi:hypothetical protein